MCMRLTTAVGADLYLKTSLQRGTRRLYGCQRVNKPCVEEVM